MDWSLKILLFPLLLLLVACGGGGSSGRGNVEPAPTVDALISGVVTKGPVAGAQAVALAADSLTEIARAQSLSDAAGSFTINLGSYRGPVLVELRGGTYTDEATGVMLDAGMIRAVSHTLSNGGTTTLQVNPVTDAVWMQLNSTGDALTESNIATANRLIFGDLTLDLFATAPTDLTIAGPVFSAANPADVYGLLLAVVSQLQADDAQASNWRDSAGTLTTSLDGTNLNDFYATVVTATDALVAAQGPTSGRVTVDVNSQLANLLNLPSRLNDLQSGKLAAGVLELLSITAQLTSKLEFVVNDNFSAGVLNQNCDLGGSLVRSLSDDRATLETVYTNCEGTFVDDALEGIGGLTRIDGRRSVAFARVPSVNGYAARVTYDDLKYIDSNQNTTTLDGAVTIDTPSDDAMDVTQATLDLTITRDLEAVVTADGVELSYIFGGDFFNSLVGTNAISGTIEHSIFGRAALMLEGNNILIAGAEGTGAELLNVLPSTRVRSLTSNRFALFDRSDVLGNPIYTSDQTAPAIRSEFLPELDEISFDAQVVAVDLSQLFFDVDFDLLDVEVHVSQVAIEASSYELDTARTLVAGDPDILLAVENLGDGEFAFTSNTIGQRKRYSLDITAVDSAGSARVHAREFVVDRDLDMDGVGDFTDPDDDNDGVNDFSDAFPSDPLETIDTDNDGIGNNADTDDDNDGVPDSDDAYPQDNRCHLPGDGDGQQCRLTSIETNSLLLTDIRGVVYIGNSSIPGYNWQRFDALNGTFLDSITFDGSLFPNAGEQQFGLQYLAGVDSLFGFYGTEGISRLDLANGTPEAVFHLPAADVLLSGVRSVGSYIIVRDQVVAGARFTVYDAQGDFVASREEVFDAINRSRILTAAQASFCGDGFYFDLATTSFVDFTNPGGYDCRIIAAPLTSPTAPIALQPNQGVVVDTQAAVLWTPPFQSQQRCWATQGLVLSFAASATVQVFDDAGNLLQTLDEGFPGSPELDLLCAGDRVLVAYRFRGAGNEGVRFTPLLE